MSLAILADGPRVLPYGQQRNLTLDVYEDSTNTQQTCTAATVQVYIGGVEKLAATAATALGPPAYYTLASSVLGESDLSEEYLEIWETTIGGAAQTFRVSGYVVRQEYRGTVTDAALAKLHRKIARIRDPDDSSFGTAIDRARAKIERDLIRMQRRPWLVFDPWALYDAHCYLALSYVFFDAWHASEDDVYAERAKEYEEKYEREFGQTKFRYDENESGLVQSGSVQEAASGPICLSSAPMWRGVI